MAAPSRRHCLRRRRTALVFAAAVVTAGLVASLVMVLRPGHGVDTGHTVATAVAGPKAIVQPRAHKRKPSTASTAATTAATTAAAAGTTAPTQPSATSTEPMAAAAAPLAGRMQPEVTYRGDATFYEAGDGDGACLFGPSDDLMIAAMNHTDYESAKACGAYVLVQAANGNSVTVKITNECPLPCAPGQLDLSAQAFAKLADPSLGQIPITWSLLSPSTSDTISIRYKTGSTRWWCGIQVIDHRNPVARLAVRTSSGWRQLPRTEYNYFLAADGSGCGGAIRITDIYGEELAVDGIALQPDVAQPTQVQFAEH